MTQTLHSVVPIHAPLLRDEFPSLGRYAWFNTPGVPPAPRCVVQALQSALDLWLSGEFDWLEWERDAEAARACFARLLGVPSTTVGIVTSLAEAASTVAESLIRQPRRGEVVVPAREFRSNFMPWKRMADAGFVVTAVELENPSAWTSTLVDAISEKTVVVALSDVQSATGVRANIPAIQARCREVGAQVFLNLTQSMGALASRPWHAEVDYVAVHAYKWLLSPRGAAFLYVRADRLAQTRPLSPNWKSVSDPYGQLYGDAPALAAAASKLDSSLPWFSWVGTRAALQLLATLDATAVESHCLALAHEFRSRLRARAFDVMGEDEPSQIVSIRVPDGEAAMRSLASANVKASLRDGFIRFGCHLFNSQDDVESAVDALPGVE